MIPNKGTRSWRKRELYKLIIAKSDIEYALATCRLMLREVPSFAHELFYPIHAATVVCYGRPFSANKPFGPLPKPWGLFSNAALQSMHADLLAARNEVVAHSDWSKRAVRVLVPWSLPGQPEPVISKPGYIVSDAHIPPERFPEIERTCLDLLGRLAPAIEAELTALFSSVDAPEASIPLTFDEGL